MSKIIRVESCRECPFLDYRYELWICGFPKKGGPEVEVHYDEIHPDCPLEEETDYRMEAVIECLESVDGPLQGEPLEMTAFDIDDKDSWPPFGELCIVEVKSGRNYVGTVSIVESEDGTCDLRLSFLDEGGKELSIPHTQVKCWAAPWWDKDVQKRSTH